MSKYNVLILEDSVERHASFRRIFSGHNVVIVETVDEAIRELSLGKWDWLFLDHDLGGKTMVESGPGTGYEVAMWLRDRPEMFPDRIIIHSFNPEGSKRMWSSLPGSYLVPGAWGYTDLLENWDKASEILETQGSRSPQQQ
jgi:CheY-like chemotaxis protein